MSFYTDVLKRDPRFQNPNVRQIICDMNLLEPAFRSKVVQMQEHARAAGHELRIQETFRSQQRQYFLYTERLTELSHVGMHGYGLAADLALFRNGKYDPDGVHYEFMHAMSVIVKVISGQGWGTAKERHTFTDWDHIQAVPIFRQDSVFAGTWYPSTDGSYDPWLDMLQNHVAGIG